ncbi:hypothetical protein [Photobacterium sanguinicancri]|uniref:DUF805 domain-containing protein n=1 Tax=Photobacterium sanguinicancri TaxID=875932 RepID=A0ABX4FUA5_9GAMM|nr:hypothetical protein [Photobacterium sanguinicancri]OZS42195.1 hypothetical protein ASV53_19750 [Photobacterium sanguinicancri]
MDELLIKNITPNSQPEHTSTYQLKHYLREADWTLSRLFAFVFNAIIFLSLMTLSLISLGFELINILEYQEGLADISTIEIVFIVSLLVLLKRYWAYTAQTSFRWWNILASPLLWYGKFVLITWFCASFIVFGDFHEGTDHFQTVLIQGQSYSQLLSFTYILISLYIAVPSQSLIIKQGKADLQPAVSGSPEATQTKPEVENVQ